MKELKSMAKKPKPKLPAGRYSINFNTGMDLSWMDEAEPLIPIQASIDFTPDGDGAREEEPEPVGFMRATLVSWHRAINEGLDLEDSCDSHSQELHTAFSTVWNAEEERYLGEIADGCGDLLVIHEVGLVAKYRGHDLGLFAVRRLMDCYHSNVVVLHPAPIRPDKITDVMNDAVYAKACAKLARHWGRLGFRRITESPLYYLNTELVSPSTADLMNHRPQK